MSQELENAQGGVVENADAQAQTTAANEQTRQPVDLTQFPEFRSWQSSADARVAQAQRAAQEAQQQARALQAQWHQERMQGMDEAQRIVYENNLLRQQLQEQAQQRELEQYAYTRARDIDEIHRSTGVAKEELEKFPTVHDAWAYAVNQMAKSPAKTAAVAKAQAAEAETPDPVDIGAGKAVDPATKLYNEWKDAVTKEYDMTKAMRLEEKALKAGIDISTWSVR